MYTSKDKQKENNGNSTLDIKMEAFDWLPDRLLILRYNLQNVIQKKQAKSSEKN